MHVFFHVVGEQGAARDFPRTVFSQVDLTGMLRWVAQKSETEAAVLHEAIGILGSTKTNVRGAPAGALRVLANLRIGDCVLLVRNVAAEGEIPALAEVRFYRNQPLPYTSDWLWGESRYPVIFFFTTETLDLTWAEFDDHLNFNPNYRPPAHVQSIADDRLDGVGGAAALVRWVRQHAR